VQLAADCRLRRGVVAVVGQVLAQQRDGPLDGPVAQGIRPPGQRLAESGAPLLGPNGGVVAAPAVAEAGGGALGLEAEQPLVDAHAASAQQAGDLRDGTAGSDLQQGEGPAVEHGVARQAELFLQLRPLASGQLELAHGAPRPPAYRPRNRV
jgi:hypothetical protein